MVTGSVADNVAPTDNASIKVMFTLSNPNAVHIYIIIPRTIADINVPGIANVSIDTILLKKLT